MSIKIISSTKVERISDGIGNLKSERGVLNVISEKDYFNIVNDVLSDISETVGQTLGPFGKTVLVTEPYGTSPVFPSKDGFRIMLNFKYDNPVYDTIYKINRDVSVRLNQKVGDSTTSGNIIIAAFFKMLRELIVDKKTKYTTTAIRNILKASENIICEKLKDYGYIKTINDLSKEEKRTIIKKVATVAANNDYAIGELIANLFEKFDFEPESFIDIERSKREDTYIDDDMGFELPVGIIHQSMVNDVDGMTCTFKEPFFLMVDGPLVNDDLYSLSNWVFYVTIELKKPLVIIASSYSNEVLNWIISARAGVVDKKTGEAITLPIAALILDDQGTASISDNRLTDLNYALGGIVLPTKNGRIVDANKIKPMQIIQYLGQAEIFKSQMFHTRIIGGKGDPDKINARIKEIELDTNSKSLQDSVEFQSYIARNKKRIAMLRSRMVTIYAGGSTFKEKEYNKLVLEDAVYAARSTIENGYTLGGNVSVTHLINHHRNELIQSITQYIIDNKITICVGNKENDIKNIVSDVLDILSYSFGEAYRRVLQHANLSGSDITSIINTCVSDKIVKTFNLLSETYETIDSTDVNLIVAGNTDQELLHAVFAVTTILITSSNLMLLYNPGVSS